jgi:hypothetical protein
MNRARLKILYQGQKLASATTMGMPGQKSARIVRPVQNANTARVEAPTRNHPRIPIHFEKTRRASVRGTSADAGPGVSTPHSGQILAVRPERS